MTAIIIKRQAAPDPFTITRAGPSRQLVTVSTQNPTGQIAAIIGPPGPASAGTLSGTAGANIGGHRIVAFDENGSIIHADSQNISALRVAGISEGAALSGQSVNVNTGGKTEMIGWNWNAGQVYLGTDGQPTQVIPTTGFLFRIGTAAGPQAILIEPQLIAAL